jgi:hypothetical protein
MKAFRTIKSEPEKLSIRERFVGQLERLLERMEVDPRIDFRDAIGALSLIDRYLAREKADDGSTAGSAIRKFEGAFQKADGAGRRAAAPGEPDEGADAAGDDPGEHDGSGGPADPPEDGRPAA